jgi:rhodanese-related sulfurtransferase
MIRQAVIVVAISAALGLLRNYVFSGGIELIADPARFRTGSSLPVATAGQVDQMFEDGVAVFIDARDRPDYENGHVEGAANLDIRRFDRLYKQLGRFIGADTPLVVYAERNEPQKAGAIADKLSEAGHELVYIAVAGLEGLSEFLPVETGPDPWTARK